jgi:transposase
MTTRAADGLGQLTDRVAGAEVVGLDETGLRVAGKPHWVHCARTDRYTLITCHAKRGRKGIDDAGVLGRFRGVAVHDAWAPYDTYVEVEHQLCCAHALRELQAVAETAPPETEWCWAGQTAARSSQVMRKHNALARRLIDRQDDYLRFTTDRRIPADNKGSEGDIRMIKLRQKVSGCLRTLTGATQFCAIRSYLSTATKHGHRVGASTIRRILKLQRISSQRSATASRCNFSHHGPIIPPRTLTSSGSDADRSLAA